MPLFDGVAGLIRAMFNTKKSGLQKATQFAATLLIGAAVFLVTGGPRGGGGGGHGSGGGGGGSHSTHISSGHSSSPNTVTAYLTTEEATEEDVRDFALVFWPSALVLCGGFYALNRKYNPPRSHLVTMAWVLRNGPDYARKIKEQIRRADFFDETGRGNTMRRMLAVLDPADIVEGYVFRGERPGRRGRYGDLANRVWGRQMYDAEITPPTPKKLKIVIDKRDDFVGEGSVCLIGFILTMDRKEAFTTGGTEEARKAMATLKEVPPQAFYVFYAPEPEEPLAEAEAIRLLGKVRDGDKTG